jgi:hypothetical protein
MSHFLVPDYLKSFLPQTGAGIPFCPEIEFQLTQRFIIGYFPAQKDGVVCLHVLGARSRRRRASKGGRRANLELAAAGPKSNFLAFTINPESPLPLLSTRAT